MKNILIFISLFTITIFLSCDEIEKPYERTGGTDPEPTGDIAKKVLIEEFTGHKCPNCPEGANELERLHGIYKDTLIAMAIHSGFFAIPQASPFDTDFRTVEGNAITDFFNVLFYPTGLVNRTEYDGEELFQPAGWESQVIRVLSEPGKVTLEMELDYSTNTRNLDVDFTVSFTEDLEGMFRIAAFLVEDSIIAAQDVHGTTVEDYVHRHVLRDGLTDNWTGDLLTDNVVAEQVYTFTINNYNISNDYDENHCEVIAYVFNQETNEIMQVEKIEVLE